MTRRDSTEVRRIRALAQPRGLAIRLAGDDGFVTVDGVEFSVEDAEILVRLFPFTAVPTVDLALYQPLIAEALGALAMDYGYLVRMAETAARMVNMRETMVAWHQQKKVATA